MLLFNIQRRASGKHRGYKTNAASHLYWEVVISDFPVGNINTSTSFEVRLKKSLFLHLVLARHGASAVRPASLFPVHAEVFIWRARIFVGVWPPHSTVYTVTGGGCDQNCPCVWLKLENGDWGLFANCKELVK